MQMRRDGSVVTEMMYRLNIAEKDKKQKQREAFDQIVFDKKQELKQQREALILKTMDEISKREKVMQMKVVTSLFSFIVGPIANLKGHYFQPSLSVSLSVCVSLTGTSTLQC